MGPPSQRSPDKLLGQAKIRGLRPTSDGVGTQVWDGVSF